MLEKDLCLELSLLEGNLTALTSYAAAAERLQLQKVRQGLIDSCSSAACWKRLQEQKQVCYRGGAVSCTAVVRDYVTAVVPCTVHACIRRPPMLDVWHCQHVCLWQNTCSSSKQGGVTYQHMHSMKGHTLNSIWRLVVTDHRAVLPRSYVITLTVISVTAADVTPHTLQHLDSACHVAGHLQVLQHLQQRFPDLSQAITQKASLTR